MPTGRNRRRSGTDRSFAQLAERHRRNGNLELAVELCREGLAEYPDHLSGRVTLGWALLELGEHEAARAELESVLKRAPDNLTAIRGLAELHDRTESTLMLDMDAPADWPGALETEGFDAAELARAADDEADETASLIDPLSNDAVTDTADALVSNDAEPDLIADSDLASAFVAGQDTDETALSAPVAETDTDTDDLRDVLARFEAANADEVASAFESALDRDVDVAPDLLVDETVAADQIYRFGHDEPRAESDEVAGTPQDISEPEAADAADLIDSFQSAEALAAPVADLDESPVEHAESAEEAASGGSDSDLSDAVAAFAAATERSDESPAAAYDAGEDGVGTEPGADELVTSGLEAAELMAGHADAAALADDMAAYAEADPGPVEPPAQSAEAADLSSPLGSAEIAESDRHAGELVAGLSALAAYQSSAAADATEAGQPAIASGEDSDALVADAPLADLDDPLVAGVGMPSVMEEAASFVAPPLEEAASDDETGFDLPADLALESGAPALFEAYEPGAFDSAIETEAVEVAFEGLHGAEDLVEAAADRDELAWEGADPAAFDDDHAHDATEPAALAPPVDLAPAADWTPPLPSSPKPAPEPEPVSSGFELPLEFGPKAVARMQAVAEPAHPAPIVEADEAADLVANTPQIRLERLLRRVQVRRLRRVVDTVA